MPTQAELGWGTRIRIRIRIRKANHREHGGKERARRVGSQIPGSVLIWILGMALCPSIVFGMTRVGGRNGSLPFERKLTIQPLGFIRAASTILQGTEITYPPVEVDRGECVTPHELQPVFVANVECARTVLGQQLRRSTDERLPHVFIGRDLQSSSGVGHERLAPDRLDPRRSPALVFDGKNEPIGRWRFYADNEIGSLDTKGDFHGLFLRADAILRSTSRFPRLPRLPDNCAKGEHDEPMP